MSVPAAVYLHVPTDRGTDVVGVLTSDAARLPLGCVLFRPSNGRPLVAAAQRRPGPGRRRPDRRRRPRRQRRRVVGPAAQAAHARARRCCPRACASCAPRSTARACRTARSRCRACPTGPGGPLAALRGAVRRADLDAALRTATRLIGLGPGLTPAGDDVMAGTIAGLVLLGPPGRGAVRRRGLPRWPPAARPSCPGRCCGTPPRAGQRRVRRRAARPGRRAAAGAGDRRRCWRPARPAAGRMALGLCTAIDLVDRTTRPR